MWSRIQKDACFLCYLLFLAYPDKGLTWIEWSQLEMTSKERREREAALAVLKKLNPSPNALMPESVGLEQKSGYYIREPWALHTPDSFLQTYHVAHDKLNMDFNIKVKGDPYGNKEQWYIGVRQPGPLMMDCFRNVNVSHSSDMMPFHIRAEQAQGTFVEALQEEIQERNMSAGKRARMLSHEQINKEVQTYNNKVAADKAL